jgi:HD superfamily phosphodiesterase
MNKVAILARDITLTDYYNYQDLDKLILDVLTVALLHDVADHKYDYEGTLQEKLDNFGYLNIKNYEDIKKVINLISFSKENKALQEGKQLNYLELLGEHYKIVRQIVSDADKIEAIGKCGIDRCISYIKHKNPEFTKEEIYKNMLIHSKEKLLKIKDHFIKTPTGKKMAIPLHKEMVEYIKILEKFYL